MKRNTIESAMEEALFRWTCATGETGYGDVLPVGDVFVTITELELFRQLDPCSAKSHTEHEAVITALPPGLLILRANGCRIRRFPVLPVSILEVYFEQNDIMRLPPLQHLTNCIVLEFSDNRIEEINCGTMPPMLARLGVEVNALQRVRGILPTSCQNWSFKDNPSGCVFENPDYQTRHRFIGQVFRREERAAHAPPNPYTNQQSVHNSSIQRSVRGNLPYIVDYRPDLPADPHIIRTINRAYSRIWSMLRITGHLPGTKLQTYLATPYSQGGVTMERLIDRLWLRISHAPAETRAELMRRFQEEVNDGTGMCSNGMFTRLVNNVLLGFDDNIQVRMSNSEILSTRIPQTMGRVRREMDLSGGEPGTGSLAYWATVYKQTVRDLAEVEEPRDKWQPWLEPISEEFCSAILLTDRAALEAVLRTDGVGEVEKWESLRSLLQERFGCLGLPWEMDMLRQSLEGTPVSVSSIQLSN